MGKKHTIRFEPDQMDRMYLAQLDETLASDPDNPDANCKKGDLLLKLCRGDEALEHFERVLRQDTAHMPSWVGKGLVYTLQEKYNKAEECFAKVPEGDDAYDDAQEASRRNKWYRDRRGRVPTKTEETIDERNYNDALENWLGQHLDRIQNLRELLHKFRCARDGRRRKDGNVFHTYLVRLFYELGGPLRVVTVECKGIEPGTDVDIRLEGDIFIQAWSGKMPLDHELPNILFGNRTQIDMDWCEELKPVKKKLSQLPSKTGKGFVLNWVPDLHGFKPSPLHELCSERKCVMMMGGDKPRIDVYGTSDFKYRDEACQIARVLGRPLKFFLGDWNKMRAHGRDPIGESAYGFDVSQSPYRELYGMDREGLLNYAKQELKDPHYDELANLHRHALLGYVLNEAMWRDSDCPEDKSGRPYSYLQLLPPGLLGRR